MWDFTGAELDTPDTDFCYDELWHLVFIAILKQ